MAKKSQFNIKMKNLYLNKDKYRVPAFIISNENLVSAKRILSKIEVDNFIGICGGGTQILYILSLLTRKNKLKSIKLIDYNKNQLLNFNYILKAYEKNKDPIHYIADLSKRPDFTDGKLPWYSSLYDRSLRFIAPMLFNKDYGFEETNLRRPKIKGNLRIELIHETFDKYFKTAKLKKKKISYLYFKYFHIWYWAKTPI